MLSLGMDIGTSTVKLVLLRDGAMAKQWMAVHHGRPFACLKKGLSALELDADTPFSLCVTGSNTEALLEQAPDIPSFGDIPAVVEGVRQIVPQAGSVIEIGSQGARFITDLQSRAPQFAVNEHCAGGTGSFFEDQMSRVGCKLEDYSSLVEQAQSVPRLSVRCAVFAKTDIIHRQQEGAATPDILLGLCYAMIRNYKATIVRRLPVCKPVVFCGGVTCNTGVIRAIREVFGLTEEELIVPEFARYEAALGAALKASGSFTLRQLNDSLDSRSAEIQKNIDFYKQADKLLLEGYTGKRDPRKKTVGVPFALMIHKFFPMANAFFTSLGFNVVLTDPTSEETIRLAQQTAQGETCYPVKLIYGHMQQLIDQKVDYIFLPTIHTMKHEKSRVKHNYGCVYMQTAAASIAKALDIESKGITLLSPVFDLDFGQEAMASAMLGLSKILGIPKPFCAKALLSGAMAVRRHTAAVEKQGKALLATLRPDDKVLVLITRNYGVSDPILNMGMEAR